MPKLSAGILLYKLTDASVLEVLLVHPGGPFWAKKDEGAWSIPKGECDAGEERYQAALREFAEELGSAVPAAGGPDIDLGAIKQAGGKAVYVWARAADFDATTLKSNAIEIDWPPRSGKQQIIPEVDRAEWFSLAQARQKLLKGQLEILDRLQNHLAQQGITTQEGQDTPKQASLF